MTDLRTEAMKMALEALEVGDSAQRAEAVIALSDALAQPEQEPVDWMDDYNACKCPDNESRCFSDRVFRMMQKYTAPPKRDWQGLTDEEVCFEYQKLWPFHPAEEPRLTNDILEFTKAIEAKLKEKNT